MDNYFVENFPQTSNSDLSKHYNVSRASIQRWAKELNLSKSTEYISTIQKKRRKNMIMTEEIKRKISNSRKGIKLTQKTINKIIETKKQNNSIPKGETHYNWKGGKPWERFKNPEYIAWRNQVLERDNYICQQCQRQCKKYEKGLAAHHIKEYAICPELRYEISNGLTMCRKCHMELHGKRLKEKEKILCACGCGTLIDSVDVYGRPRQYVNYHSSKGKPKPESMKRLLSEQRKGRKLSEEHKQKIALGLQNTDKRIGRPPSH